MSVKSWKIEEKESLKAFHVTFGDVKAPETSPNPLKTPAKTIATLENKRVVVESSWDVKKWKLFVICS